MKLITPEIEKKIPKIYETELGKEKTLWLKFFTPWTYWTWYVAEYNADERLCYGYAIGHENEWGYFNLDELESIRGPFGLKIERDLSFEPINFSKLGR